LNPFRALGGFFSEPGKTFEGLVKAPTWWLPMLLLVVSVAASIWVASPKMDYEQMMRESLEKRAEKTGAKVSETQVSDLAERSRKFAWLGAPIGTVVVAVVAFGVAGVLWGSAKAFGGEIGYAQMLAIYGHANLPNVAGTIVAIPLFLAQPDASLTQKSAARVLASNLGALLPFDAPSALYAAASSVDLFSLWCLTLLVIGFRKIPELPRGAATAIPIVLWVLYVVGKVGWRLAFPL